MYEAYKMFVILNARGPRKRVHRLWGEEVKELLFRDSRSSS